MMLRTPPANILQKQMQHSFSAYYHNLYYGEQKVTSKREDEPMRILWSVLSVHCRYVIIDHQGWEFKLKMLIW